MEDMQGQATCKDRGPDQTPDWGITEGCDGCPGAITRQQIVIPDLDPSDRGRLGMPCKGGSVCVLEAPART